MEEEARAGNVLDCALCPVSISVLDTESAIRAEGVNQSLPGEPIEETPSIVMKRWMAIYVPSLM